ncbi:USP14 family protein [Megaselia abdita]
MPCYKVKVKWGKENFPNIEVNTDETPILFKAQLFALTGVQPDRQKVLFKGSVLKDDNWNMELREGATVLLLGTKEEVPVEPVQRTVFVEDMDESELATAMEVPAGLTNLGNTCYMNAVVQCLNSVSELRDALKSFEEPSASSSQSITSVLKKTFARMETGGTAIPMILLETLHANFPQFAQTGENGAYRQQDANECWCELLKLLQQKLPPKDNVSKYKSFIEQYFGGSFEVTMKCGETDDEPVTKTVENFLQLSCFISQEVKYMHSGLKSKLQETLTKRSEILGRDATYNRSSLISRLPSYLTVQFVRFQYKGKEGINAKVLKDIKFPLDFDAYELCSPDLQAKLTPMRSKFKEIEDAALEKSLKDKNIPMKGAEKKEIKTKSEQFWFEDDLGSNNSGYYTLQAVLTHKGRSSSSGHYVGWVRQKGDLWMKFDDDVVSPVNTDDILKLSGGGDWHCAYVLLYGPRVLEIPIEEGEGEPSSVISMATD